MAAATGVGEGTPGRAGSAGAESLPCANGLVGLGPDELFRATLRLGVGTDGA